MPLPLVAPAPKVVAVPPMTRSLAAATPVTDSLKVTLQARLVALVSPSAGVQAKAEMVGSVRSTVTAAAATGAAGAVLPAASATVPALRVAMTVPSLGEAPVSVTV